MSKSNGYHSNGQDGGEGGGTLMEQPGDRKRDSLRIIQRAVVNGWDIPDEWTAKLPKIAAQIAMDTNRNDRDRLRALEVLKSMARDRVDAAVMLDKIERLDSDRPTEHHKLALPPDSREAVMNLTKRISDGPRTY